MANKKIRVFIVDDSSVVRMFLTHLFSSSGDFEVVGTAPDPYIARDMIVNIKPDVMTLDIEMPKMDGVTFLEKVMRHFPIRTVIISSLSVKGSELALRALEVGAVDVIAKPAINVANSLQVMGAEIVERVKVAAGAQLRQTPTAHANTGNATAKSPLNPSSVPRQSALAKTTHQVLAIASSTGGTEALKVVLGALPHDIPGTVIVQHMPPVFTKTFADSLQKLCPFEVREAKDGDRVLPGVALIAPGNYHMEMTRSGAYYYVKLHQEAALHGVRPAADYLMKSVAKAAGANAIGVVLTGMGRDGADGLAAMKAAGSYNIAQDEKSCVVFGMPKAAIEAGAIHTTVSLNDIAPLIHQQIRTRAVA